MYSYEARIRYSECGSDRRLTIPALINLFQNCSSFHSEDIGVGIDYVSMVYIKLADRYWENAFLL